MLIMSCWPWWNGAKWPDRKARLPFATQDRLQKFRLFLKYVGGSHWEHNKKLVKISFVSTNLLFWIPKPSKENLNKKDMMHGNITCSYDKIGNSKPPEKFDWMTFAHGIFHTFPLTFPLYTLEAHTILMAKIKGVMSALFCQNDLYQLCNCQSSYILHF